MENFSRANINIHIKPKPKFGSLYRKYCTKILLPHKISSQSRLLRCCRKNYFEIMCINHKNYFILVEKSSLVLSVLLSFV